MLAIKGIYAPYGVQRLNHGIGFNTAAIELLLPTYGEPLGPQGQDLHALGPQPAPDADPGDREPAGWSRSTASAREVGMEDYVARAPRRVLHRPRRLPALQPRASARRPASTPATCSSARRCRSTCDGNSSTVTLGRIAGFGGAPNMGADPHGRRHSSARLAEGRREAADAGAACARGRKLVVQIVRDLRREQCAGASSRRSTRWTLGEQLRHADLPPVMIYGDDVTPHRHRGRHRQPLLCAATRGARAGDPRRRRLYPDRRPGATGAHGRAAARARRCRAGRRTSASSAPRPNRTLLAARCVEDLVRWSGGLYQPPERFR